MSEPLCSICGEVFVKDHPQNVCCPPPKDCRELRKNQSSREWYAENRHKPAPRRSNVLTLEQHGALVRQNAQHREMVKKRLNI